MAENTENIEKTAEELAAEKAATVKKTDKAPKVKGTKDAVIKPASATKPSTEKTSDVLEREEAKEVAKRCDVKVIYKNTMGEYFTSPNLAIASEKGFKEKVKTFEF